MLERILNDIKRHEGLSLTVYDCPTGFKTIGYGRNLETNGITKKEAELLLLNDVIGIKLSLVDELDFFIDLDDKTQYILINMSYQIGIAGLLKFKKTLNYIKLGQYFLASKEMLDSKWAKQTPNRANELSNLMKGGN